jgi:hypothetical protein
MNTLLHIGFVGCGSFVQHFIPLFKAHPTSVRSPSRT